LKWAQLVELNPWWKSGNWAVLDPDLANARPLLTRPGLHLDLGKIYLVRGVRRAGKTTYVKQLIRDIVGATVRDPRTVVYITCDRLTGGRRELGDAVGDFFENMRPDYAFICLDEVTYLEDWHLFLKELAESTLAPRRVVLATGSNPAMVKSRAERLPGRRIEGNEYLMYPLSFRQFIQNFAGPLSTYAPNELRQAAAEVSKLMPIALPPRDDQKEVLSTASVYVSELNSLFRTYLLTGGFPRPIIEYFRDKKISAERYEELVRLVLGDISNAGLSEDIAKSILRRITARESYGQRATLRGIGEDTGYPHNTVGSYLEALEDAMILIALGVVQPHKWKIRPKSPKKFYLTDPFILHSMQGFFSGVDCYRLSEETLADEDTVSKIVEGVVRRHWRMKTRCLRLWKVW